ncbi:hypothetical protein M1D97_00800 [Kushneria sp. AK178]
MKSYRVLALLPLAALLSACGDPQEASEGNFRSALQDDVGGMGPAICLEAPAPRLPFVMNQRAAGQQSDMAERTKRANALVDAGLLEREDLSDGRQRYSLTDDGRDSYARAHGLEQGGFCFGKVRIEGVDSFTPAQAIEGGFTVSHVRYSYSVRDIPSWAEEDSLRQAYQGGLEGLDDTRHKRAMMILTNQGWQTERRFAE